MEIQVLSAVRPPDNLIPFATVGGFLDFNTEWVTIHTAQELWECDSYIRRITGDKNHIFRVGQPASLSVSQRPETYYCGKSQVEVDVLVDLAKAVIPDYEIYKLDFLMGAATGQCSWELVNSTVINQWGVHKKIRQYMRVDPASLYAVLCHPNSIEFYYDGIAPITPLQAAGVILNAPQKYRFS